MSGEDGEEEEAGDKEYQESQMNIPSHRGFNSVASRLNKPSIGQIRSDDQTLKQ